MTTAIDPALAAALRDLLLRVDSASATAAEAVQMAEARARSAEAVALGLREQLQSLA